MDPPSRSSMFRLESSDPIIKQHAEIIQPNYEDNQLNCGGLQVTEMYIVDT